MTSIAIVTDSTCDMPEDWSGWRDIHVIPIHIRFGQEAFREGIDLDESAFYQRVERDGVIPQTSQPSPGEFADLYRSLSARYEAVISMHVTGKLSGTVQSATLAAEMVKDDIIVHPFDSLAGSAGLGFMAMEALECIEQGKTLEQILERLNQIRESVQILLTPASLKYAQMSGRISALGSALASLLNIKPIIVLDQGMLVAGENVRTRRRAINRMLEMMRDRFGSQPVRVAVVHAQAPQAITELVEMTRNALNCDRVWVTTLAPSVAVHLGPGTIGLVAYRL